MGNGKTKPQIICSCHESKCNRSVFHWICHTVCPVGSIYCSVTTDAFVGYLVNCTNGAAYPAVKAEHFINAEITVPTNALLDEFGRITIPMYRKMEKISTQLRLLTEARDRLLPKLMSGEIEV